ncbi:hypothetical protein EDB81DRAFT_125988 [Dactylonectria macrodidyma]|uniref:Uncharacterized protein n=1 Tax=Dactylonectria macrodidyma TaxID=307937 RepID=A0A9P9E8N7_9HYPO|nr:hypothetical protein EDB81DRAFT_125988 [Dactylonectria macrodidyma]
MVLSALTPVDARRREDSFHHTNCSRTLSLSNPDWSWDSRRWCRESLFRSGSLLCCCLCLCFGKFLIKKLVFVAGRKSEVRQHVPPLPELVNRVVIAAYISLTRQLAGFLDCKCIIETKKVPGVKGVLRDLPYPVEVDDINHAAVLDLEGKVFPGTMVALAQDGLAELKGRRKEGTWIHGGVPH